MPICRPTSTALTLHPKPSMDLTAHWSLHFTGFSPVYWCGPWIWNYGLSFSPHGTPIPMKCLHLPAALQGSCWTSASSALEGTCLPPGAPTQGPQSSHYPSHLHKTTPTTLRLRGTESLQSCPSTHLMQKEWTLTVWEKDTLACSNAKCHKKCAVVESEGKEQWLHTWCLNLLLSHCSAAVELRIQ